MRNDLPDLNAKCINTIFNYVYDLENIKNENDGIIKNDVKLLALLDVFSAMQKYNYQFRPNDLRETYSIASKVIDFEINSEGTSLWLALILAIKELYGLSDTELIKILKKITIRK